ncbi:MAG TPA: glycosyltransferase family 2 protein [Gammaproteobacteria bacterium]|nr:glycosyltransferase family 2 protein [Gammaproteobacteria bacterium]
MASNAEPLSIIIPALNEADNLRGLLPELRAYFPDAEVLVVDDASGDDTHEVCCEYDVRVESHLYTLGNGAAVKTGARHARGRVLVFMDADGQHQPADIGKLLSALDEGFDMAIGARDRTSQASAGRGIANRVFNSLASYLVGHPVLDLTSGFRAVDAEKFREYLFLLPNGFSYPSTITMAFFRAGYGIKYVPIHAPKRGGKSHLRPLKEGARFLLIIFKIGTLYSPLKLFMPVSVGFLLLAASYAAYTLSVMGRFTNMSVLLFSVSILVLLIGLVSEQVTALLYRR